MHTQYGSNEPLSYDDVQVRIGRDVFGLDSLRPVGLALRASVNCGVHLDRSKWGGGVRLQRRHSSDYRFPLKWTRAV